MSQRKLTYLNNHRIVYRRLPINDTPDKVNEVYAYYMNGTHECYELFRSKAKITTYKSLKWHLLVLWYLNPQLDQDDFMSLAEYICHKPNGFISFAIHSELLRKIVYEVSMLDLDKPLPYLNITLRSLFFGGSSKSSIDTSYTILRNKSACIAKLVKPLGL